MDTLEIKLQTVTPLWTGGTDGQADRLHMTGLMGSLRWWYEVLVRSVGGNGCDPGQHSCVYDRDKPGDGLCDVCRIFGATGWARRFRLMISEENLQRVRPVESRINNSKQLEFFLSRNHPASHERGHRWYLPGNPLSGEFTLRVIPTGSLDEAGQEPLDPKLIGGLFQLIADRASIGAKPQMGLGVIEVVNRQDVQSLFNHLAHIVTMHQKKGSLRINPDNSLPCLQNMFFARMNVSSASEATTFDLKYNLRNMLREEFKDQNELRHTIMGYVRGDNRIGAKIMMSYPYGNGIIRSWGWLPKLQTSQPSLDDLLTEIYYYLADTYGEDNVSFWLDYNPRKNSSILEYIKNKLFVGENHA